MMRADTPRVKKADAIDSAVIESVLSILIVLLRREVDEIIILLDDQIPAFLDMMKFIFARVGVFTEQMSSSSSSSGSASSPLP
ncbi:hypothetical protein [Candidatus Ichthyocystis hellenicum]|uniref:hypothetical protein n=1 Tax=Candidatus Ichthyocystis hellenicum TaxID=1561003 RepID=UPI00111299FC|nr:hypothetical protein [Candidatus Ichthyocystis hellenicum]